MRKGRRRRAILGNFTWKRPSSCFIPCSYVTKVSATRVQPFLPQRSTHFWRWKRSEPDARQVWRTRGVLLGKPRNLLKRIPETFLPSDRVGKRPVTGSQSPRDGCRHMLTAASVSSSEPQPLPLNSASMLSPTKGSTPESRESEGVERSTPDCSDLHSLRVSRLRHG